MCPRRRGQKEEGGRFWCPGCPSLWLWCIPICLWRLPICLWTWLPICDLHQWLQKHLWIPSPMCPRRRGQKEEGGRFWCPGCPSLWLWCIPICLWRLPICLWTWLPICDLHQWLQKHIWIPSSMCPRRRGQEEEGGRPSLLCHWIRIRFSLLRTWRLLWIWRFDPHFPLWHLHQLQGRTSWLLNLFQHFDSEAVLGTYLIFIRYVVSSYAFLLNYETRAKVCEGKWRKLAQMIFCLVYIHWFILQMTISKIMALN